MPRVRLTLRWLMIAVAAVAIAAWAILALSPRRFDRDAWLAMDSSYARDAAADEGRHDMAADLIARRILLGKTRAEVMAMLGSLRGDVRRDPDLVYYLGDGGWSSSEWLVIRFGPDGKVTSAAIETY